MEVPSNRSLSSILRGNLDINEKSKINYKDESGKTNLSALSKSFKNIAINCTDFKNFDGKLGAGILKTGGTALLWLASIPTGLVIPLVALHAGSALYKHHKAWTAINCDKNSPEETTSDLESMTKKFKENETNFKLSGLRACKAASNSLGKYEKSCKEKGVELPEEHKTLKESLINYQKSALSKLQDEHMQLNQENDTTKKILDLRQLSEKLTYICDQEIAPQARDDAIKLKDQVNNEIKELTKNEVDKHLERTDTPEKGVSVIKMNENVYANLEIHNIAKEYAAKTPEIEDLAPLFKAKAPEIPMSIKINSSEPETNIRSNIEDATWEPGKDEKDIRIYSNGSGGKIAMGSGYAIDGESREGDPIADDMQFKSFNEGKVLVFSGADGSGHGEVSYNTAKAANDGYMNHIVSHLTDSGVKNAAEGAELVINATAAGQKEILKTETEEQKPQRTTHLGFVASLNDQGEFDGVGSNVGDSKLYKISVGNDGKVTVTDLTRGNRGSSTDESDPGGQLGRGGATGQGANFGNLSTFFFKASSGDILVPMSDGGHDNLDPANNGHLNPQSALEEMREDPNFKLPEGFRMPTTFQENTPELGEFKDMYKEFKLGQIYNNKGDKSVAEAVVEHAYDLTTNLRDTYKNAENNKDKAVKEARKANPEKNTGKLDHISCGEFKLPG